MNGRINVKKTDYLKLLREGHQLTLWQQIKLIIILSMPAIIAQLSSIVMEYIDASMVGRLGADGSAAIGLVASSTWLLGGLCHSVTTGFTVQVAQTVGAGRNEEARKIVKLALLCAGIFSVVLMVVGLFLGRVIPVWLQGDEKILPNAIKYLSIYAISLPMVQLTGITGGMIQASGNMKLPSILHVVMCALDVIYNSIFIYGLGLGVLGAAIGTALAQLTVGVIMLWYMLRKSPVLRYHLGEKFEFSTTYLIKAVRIAIPVGIEQIVMCGAQIVSTKIVAPLGNIAIAANSLAVTAESLCYMPCYGIGAAATTLIGQSIGAGRKDLTKKLGWLVTGFGMLVMAFGGILMYIFAPQMIGILTPDPEIRKLGTLVLRIEVVAEPMYAASIVAAGVFHGAQDAVVPSLFSFISMWAVRLPLAYVLSQNMGLKGVWLAMCIELCVRGMLFLIRLSGKKWLNLKKIQKN